MKYLIIYDRSYHNGEYTEVNEYYLKIYDEKDLKYNIEKLKKDGRVFEKSIKVFKTEELFDF